MTEITADQPKCLLPIGNVPMIWYPLQTLERSGFKEAIVVVSELTKSDVSTSLEKLSLKIKIDIVAIPQVEDLGTADAIRYIHDKIYTDFLVISCDLITNINILDVLDLYRKHDASVTAVMLPVLRASDDLVTPGRKSKHKSEIDLLGIDNNTEGRLIFLGSASDFESTISMSKKLVIRHSSITVHCKFADAHLYVCKKWVLDFLLYNTKFSTLKGEFLPYIVRRQMSERKNVNDKNTSMVQEDVKEDIFRFVKENSLNTQVRQMSAFNDHSTDLEETYYGDIIRCYAYITNEKFGLRANTVATYHFANAKISELWSAGSNEQIPLPDVSNTATVRSTQVQECRIGDNTLIDEKTSLKCSYIGPNCTVESKTRISQSVIMENVTIKQRCVIHNCILCNGCTIEEGTELKDCIVGANHVVKSGSQYSREVLTDADRLIEI